VVEPLCALIRKPPADKAWTCIKLKNEFRKRGQYFARSRTAIVHRSADISVNVGVVGRLCGLVVRVPGYTSGGPGSIPDATRFSEK
jgi:hypothetical protein